MAGKIPNGRAGANGGRKLRRSASASEQSINELRYRKSTQYLFDANEAPIDLQQFRNLLGRAEAANNLQQSLEKKTRYRRTQSVTRAEEITTKEEKQRQKQPDKP